MADSAEFDGVCMQCLGPDINIGLGSVDMENTHPIRCHREETDPFPIDPTYQAEVQDYLGQLLLSDPRWIAMTTKKSRLSGKGSVL